MTHRVVCPYCNKVLKLGPPPAVWNICDGCFQERLKPLKAEMTAAIGPVREAWISVDTDAQEGE